jgi:XTP/dITP diphosphohydrolase
MPRVLIATHNRGKVGDFRAVLDPLGIEVICAADLGLDEPEETGTTFEANALLKATAAAAATGLAVFSDDSGLAIDALDGQPGVYTADWMVDAQGGRDYALGAARIQQALVERGASAPTPATFVCCLAVALPEGETFLFEARVPGTFVWPAPQQGGFGLDPHFVPDGDTRTFAQMGVEEKPAFSHRGRALAMLRKALAEDPVLARRLGMDA